AAAAASAPRGRAVPCELLPQGDLPIERRADQDADPVGGHAAGRTAVARECTGAARAAGAPGAPDAARIDTARGPARAGATGQQRDHVRRRDEPAGSAAPLRARLKRVKPCATP